MKSAFLCFLTSFMFCFYSLTASTMELDIRGSVGEIERQLHAVFPLGISKEHVVAIAVDKLQINSEDIQHHDYGDEPLILETDSKDLHVYSWLELELGEYRSIKRFFIKTTAMTKLYFDKDNKLIGLDVELYGDSL